MRTYLIIAAVVLAAVSLGIITVFIFLYSAWINKGVGSVVIPGLGLVISVPLILVVLAVIEFVISLILFGIVRQFRQ